MLMTVAEACAQLRLGKSYVYDLIARGELEAIRIGNRRRVRREALEKFINERASIA